MRNSSLTSPSMAPHSTTAMPIISIHGTTISTKSISS
jgi:hypothetical protein